MGRRVIIHKGCYLSHDDDENSYYVSHLNTYRTTETLKGHFSII